MDDLGRRSGGGCRHLLALLVVSGAAVLAPSASARASGHEQVTNCIDAVPTIVGTERPDNLVGTSGDDVIVGLGGDDVIDGGGGTDRICGGDGNDIIGAAGPLMFLSGDAGDDQIVGGSGLCIAVYAASPSAVTVDLDAQKAVGWGTDSLANIEAAFGSQFDDTLIGSGEEDLLVGGPGNDRLVGNAGPDELLPGDGDDMVDGGSDLDTVSYDDAGVAVRVSLGKGSATGAGTDTLARIEDAEGSAFADLLTGSSKSNVLAGGKGNDRLVGLAGNDRLIGGPGKDFGDGGPGRDVCKTEKRKRCP